MNIIVASVVARHNNLYLFVKETKQEANGKYGLPGGRLEPKETLEQCANRELSEETGYVASLLRPIVITHKPLTRQHNTVVRFVYAADKIVQTNKAELETVWLSFEEVKALAEQGHIRGKDVIDILEKYEASVLTIITY